MDRATLTVWGLLTAFLFLGLARPVLVWKCLGYIRKTRGLAVSLEKKPWWGQGRASGIVAGYHAGMDMFCAQKAEALPAGPSGLVSWHVSRIDLLCLFIVC